MIRPLTRADEAAVWSLLQAAADYVRLERGQEPDSALLEEVSTDAPPGLSPDDSYRAGLFDNATLLAIADMSFGYPEAGDCYLGLMLLRPTARGQGRGAQVLRHMEAVARDKGAVRMLLTVLHANRRGRSFWESQGFDDTGRSGEVTLGRRTQPVQRLAKLL